MDGLAREYPVTDNVFVIPILDRFLTYAPLYNLAALMNRTAVLQVHENVRSGKEPTSKHLDPIVRVLHETPVSLPRPLQGDLAPAFLGLLPTRECNFACRYCGFLAADRASDDCPGASKAMGLGIARDTVDWYMGLLSKAGQHNAEIHFFGGEPFCTPEILDLTVHQARIRAKKAGHTVRFEIATNGAFSKERCRWAADTLDTIVLSFDGPADIQDHHRPYRDGRGSFEIVDRNARILSEGATQLYFRSCVTQQTVGRMPEIAAWFCQNYRPNGVCFEPIQPTPSAEASQLKPPDPWEFAHGFVRAAEVLEAHGVEPIYAAADISARQVSFCPVGRDAIIVSPEGEIAACYLPRRDWEARGMDLRLGCVGEGGAVELNAEAVAFARSQNVWNKPFCATCFCRWHCAGGCHVNHVLPDVPGDYDRLCLQTRIITLRNILVAMGRQDLVHRLLEDRDALERAICQASDTLADVAEIL
jgi:uncharacterized protein